MKKVMERKSGAAVRRFRVRYEMRWAGLDFRGRRDEYTVTMRARWPSEIRRRWASSYPGTTMLEVNLVNDRSSATSREDVQ